MTTTADRDFDYTGYSLLARWFWCLPGFCHHVLTRLFGVVCVQERNAETHRIEGYRFIVKSAFDEIARETD